MDADQAELEDCRQRQDDEIIALESIFANADDSGTHQSDVHPGQPSVKLVQREPRPVLDFYLPVTLPEPTRIAVHTYVPYSEAPQTPPSSSTVQADETPKTLSNTPKGRGNRHLNAAASTFQPRPNVTNTQEEASQMLERLSLKPDTIQRPSPQQPALRSSRVLSPITHLAPITMRVELPPTYPSQQAPRIKHISAPWLPDHPSEKSTAREWILRQLVEQYHESSGIEVLYIWATFLAESLWSQLLQDASPSSAPPFLRRPPHTAEPDTETDPDTAKLHFQEFLPSPEAPSCLASQLVAHSRLCTRTAFDASSFDCAICLETRKGRACTRLSGCSHVFCSECLAGYLTSLVDDGFHRQAKRCPDPECVALWSQREKQNLVDQEGNLIVKPTSKQQKSSRAKPSHSPSLADTSVVVGQLTRSELADVLGSARLQRLDELTVKAKMEADPSVSYCPRSNCQAAVVRLSSDENSGHWERFRECLSCGFAFCAWCSRSWHGPTSCPVSFQSELIRRYLSLPPSSPDRARMEQKFGRKTLETMVRKYEEEQQTQQWLSNYTTPCPTCGIAIEKSYGCNHMTCKSCQTHYCYLCGKAISAQNPYQHFNTPGRECYHRLFDGLLGDQAPQAQDGVQQEQAHGNEQGEGARHDGRMRFALLLDENGIPIHLEPEDDELGNFDFLDWQQPA